VLLCQGNVRAAYANYRKASASAEARGDGQMRLQLLLGASYAALIRGDQRFAGVFLAQGGALVSSLALEVHTGTGVVLEVQLRRAFVPRLSCSPQ